MSRAPTLGIQGILTADPNTAWAGIFQELWDIFSAPLTVENAVHEVTERERRAAQLELLLSGSAWELWQDFEKSVPRTSQALIEFWQTNPAGKAVLILDALSLRESPWLLQEAARRGYTIHSAGVRGSELPSDTTSFAKALGFGQRSTLENNGASKKHKLPGARTESLSAQWDYCLDWIASAPSIVLWHHWPDARIHDLAEPGDGFQKLIAEAGQQLTSDSFWKMVERMAHGRRLVITCDHGYAASGLFDDVSDKEQANWLKTNFNSGRFAPANGSAQHWLPPISLNLNSAHGEYLFAVGRRKWRSPGGYPTLTHGGLSLLEVAVPFIELSKAA